MPIYSLSSLNAGFFTHLDLINSLLGLSSIQAFFESNLQEIKSGVPYGIDIVMHHFLSFFPAGKYSNLSGPQTI
jgi:hypothetical protein